MKRIFLIAAFLLACAPALAGIALVNNDSNHGHLTCTSTGYTCNTSPTDSSGATLAIADMTSGSPTMSIIDLIGAGNTNNGTSFNLWTCGSSFHTKDSVYEEICWAVAPTTSPNHVFQMTSGAGGEILKISLWGGANVVPAVYATGTNNGAGATSNVNSIATGSTGTLPEAGDLVFSGLGADWIYASSFSVTGGLSVLDTVTTSSNQAADAYVVVSATTAINATWSYTGSPEKLVASIIAFRPIVGTPLYVYNFTSGGIESPNSSTAIAANPITIPSGALVVCGVATDAGSAIPTSVTDASNTYTDTGTHLAVTTGSGSMELSVWYKANATGGSGLTPTANYSVAQYGFILCHDYVNGATSSPLDTVTSGTSTGSPISVNFSTTFANDAIFAFVGAGTSGQTTYTAGTNFTLRALDYCATQCGPGAPTPYTDIWQYHAVQDWYPNATESSQASAMTYNKTGGGGMIVAAFKGLGASATIVPRHRGMVRE